MVSAFPFLGWYPPANFFSGTHTVYSLKCDNWSSQVTLTPEVIQELKWWLESVDYWNNKVICPKSVQGQIVTDASHLGWGAIYKGHVASGVWNKRMSYLSSNERERCLLFSWL